MKIKDFMKIYSADDTAYFFICTEAWADVPEGIVQASHLDLETLLDEWGEEKIIRWATAYPYDEVHCSIGFLIE